MPKRKPAKVYKGMLESVFNRMKRTANNRKISFSVTIKYIGNLFEKQEGLCALTGEKLTLKKTAKDTTATASLDRIDSSKGYIRGNLQWIHKRVNSLKSDWNEDDFTDICIKVSTHWFNVH